MTRPVEIIAELAQGFEGKAPQASLLIRAAALAGADAVKLQLVYADELAAPDYKHYALFKALEMPDESWEGIATEASALGIELQFDIFGLRSLALAERIAGAVKLHPTDLANTGLLEAVAASSATRVILGAGGSHADEIAHACRLLASKPIIVLLGFQGYPTPDDTNQIARLGVVAAQVSAVHADARMGFADHASPDTPARYAIAAAAVGAGATVIEKHLTLGRNMKLEDHESALNPDEFGEFVATIRACGAAMGAASRAGDFGMAPAEAAYRAAIRRHVVAARPLKAGAVLAQADLTLKRTSEAQPLDDLSAAYGRRLRRDLPPDAALRAVDLE